MPIAFALHLVAAMAWVGGMTFALLILRPAAGTLDMPTRVGLWSRVLNRFIPLVWVAVITLPATGYWMIFHGFGGFAALGMHMHVMQVAGWLMIGLFLLAFLRDFLPMRRMVRELLIPEAGLYIERLRRIMQVNLVLGLLLFAVVGAGRYW
ncbi:MAG: CopD family protein [Magnetococcales bacterium]|nr:CopD family protein [Magnetococcales bacterium]